MAIAIIGFIFTYSSLESIIDSDEQYYYNLAIILCFLFWLNSYISIVNGYLASVQNYFKNFLVVSFSQLLVYLSIIAFVIALHESIGVCSIAIGLIFASILSLIINRYYGDIFHRSEVKIDIDARLLISNICLILISFLPFHAFASIAYIWAGQLEDTGCVSLLGYSHSFCGFLSTAVSMGIATVSFPDLAKSLSSSDATTLHKGFVNFRNQLEIILIFASCVAVFVSLFVHPIIEILFMRGKFDINAVDGLSSVLPIYLIDGVFIAMMNMTRNVYYSLNKHTLFAIISGIVTFVFLLSTFLFNDTVNYIVIGIVETISMGGFLIISLFYINSLVKIFDFLYVLKIIGELVLILVAGWLMLLIYREIVSLNINKIFPIAICGVTYLILVDILLSTLIKNPTVITINKKILDLLK